MRRPHVVIAQLTIPRQDDDNCFSQAGTDILAEALRRLFQPTIVWKALAFVQARRARRGLALLRQLVARFRTEQACAGRENTMIAALRNAKDPVTERSLSFDEQSDELINMLVRYERTTGLPHSNTRCRWPAMKALQRFAPGFFTFWLSTQTNKQSSMRSFLRPQW